MSLNTQLLQTIKSAYPDICPLQALLDLCRGLGYKESNGERQLRRLAHVGIIKTIRNEKHYITGYLYSLAEDPYLTPETAFNKAIGDKMNNQPPKSQNRLFQPPPIYN